LRPFALFNKLQLPIKKKKKKNSVLNSSVIREGV